VIGDGVREAWLSTLALNAAFDRPWVEAATAWALASTRGAPGPVVDVGCGAGGAAIAFARHAPGVVALDPDPRLVAVARGRAAEAGVGGQLQLAAAAIGGLPLRPRRAAVVWASGVLHHVPDQQAAVDELAALVRPGGVLALVEGGLPLRCLPDDVGLGRPGLEARLDEARARWFADLRAELGGPAMPYGWPEALARAGLADVRVRSFVADSVPAHDPLGHRIAAQHLVAARDELGDRLAPDDRTTIGRLLDPDDPAWIGGRGDLVVTAVRTVQLGVAPAG
jgi:SAM-dependent methyltransferase